jgi:SAM-dependent methyltransferase
MPDIAAPYVSTPQVERLDQVISEPLVRLVELSDSGRVGYLLSVHAWKGFPPFLRYLIAKRGLQKVCELGGGANPALTPTQIDELGVRYSVLDISEQELAKASDRYHRILADVTGDLPDSHTSSFDLVFSRMLAEHVRDPQRFHSNVYKLLKSGGYAVHFFPTLYSPPFVANLLMPERLSDWLVCRLQPTRERTGIFGKFPAYYRWCRGPTAASMRRFTSMGFEIEHYIGFFGHSGDATYGRGYYDAVGPLRTLHERLARRLVRKPNPHWTSYALLVMRRPEA